MTSDVSNIIVMTIIVGACIGLAFIPARIASKKGYSYGLFYIFGLFGVVPALITALLFKDTSAAPIGTKGTSTIVIILAIAITSIIGISIISAGTRSNPLESGPILLNDDSIQDKVTLENFNRINPGMSYSQVVNILGEGTIEGKDASGTAYSWKNNNGSIYVGFNDGKVISTQQFGLD